MARDNNSSQEAECPIPLKAEGADAKLIFLNDVGLWNISKGSLNNAIALDMMYNNIKEKDIIRNEAYGVLNKMSLLETAIHTTFWNDIFERFDETNQALQSPTITIITVVNQVPDNLCTR